MHKLAIDLVCVEKFLANWENYYTCNSPMHLLWSMNKRRYFKKPQGKAKGFQDQCILAVHILRKYLNVSLETWSNKAKPKLFSLGIPQENRQIWQFFVNGASFLLCKGDQRTLIIQNVSQNVSKCSQYQFI